MFFRHVHLATCTFLIFYNEPELGAEIDPGMAWLWHNFHLALDGDRTHDPPITSRPLYRWTTSLLVFIYSFPSAKIYLKLKVEKKFIYWHILTPQDDDENKRNLLVQSDAN